MSVEAARAAMLAACARLGVETVSLAEALGRFLAEDVVATRDQPPFAASAMDGWAVRAADGVMERRIVGASAAGRPYPRGLGPGEAARIFTGAAVPDGADTVVIQEDASRDGDRLTFPAITEPHYIRPAGQDFRDGAVLLKAGAALDPWRLSLAAAAGRASLTVARKPVVAILCTGEEVIQPGGTPNASQIFDSAGPALAGLMAIWGGAATILGAVGDDRAAIAEAVRGLDVDLLMTIGGASVGDHDLVKPALSDLGLTLAVESVAVRPGKPTSFGVLADGRRVLGLPGNPASAMVCAALFLKPILRAMQGADPASRLIPARTTAPLAANGPREHWMRARLETGAAGVLLATPMTDQDSSLVSVFADADALLVRMAGAPLATAGEIVDVLPLERQW